MKLSRRDFLGAAATATAVAAARPLFSGEVPGKSEVYVGKGTAEAILPRIVEKAGGIGNFVKPGSRVLIKPNMSFANPPEWATTTSPEALYTMAKMCVDAGARRIVICDNTLRDPELCKVKTGLAEAVKGLKGVVLFVPRQDSMYVEKSDERARALTTVDVVREVLQSDCLISLPIAKSHSAGGVSLNIKGLMGLVKNREPFHSRLDLHQAIAEQLYYMRPHLSIVDASRALLDNGPAGPGKVADLKTYVGGIDPVAVDSFTVSLASWYGRTFDGTQVKHLANASALGFGNVESLMIREIAV